MNEDELIYCVIAFAIGWLLSRHMGNGFSVGIAESGQKCSTDGGNYTCNPKDCTTEPKLNSYTTCNDAAPPHLANLCDVSKCTKN